jgi:hypothetical protein
LASAAIAELVNELKLDEDPVRLGLLLAVRALDDPEIDEYIEFEPPVPIAPLLSADITGGVDDILNEGDDESGGVIVCPVAPFAGGGGGGGGGGSGCDGPNESYGL